MANICGVSGKLVLTLLSGAVALRNHAVDCVSSLVLREVICLSFGSLFVFFKFSLFFGVKYVLIVPHPNQQSLINR